MRARTVILLLLILAGCSPAPPPGKRLELDQLRGQWVLINYWATWCKPCRQEIPELNALASQYPEVAVLGVNFDGSLGEQLAQEVREMGIAFPVLEEDPAAALGVERPAVLPTTLVIDPQGLLRPALVGPQTLASLALASGQKKPAQGAGDSGVAHEN
ncbi:MAG: TlpA family protein disulfide reductase [Pseudomonadales bacterium]|nr:TlpA family protein disulfide reductase [Halieaceae bacterium]MCP5189562.1 TlpA family protein disulfide reductase [Pseudomonadales bacterium]MCP5204796.1 TlpA family protein disulfide reductase [Pseudomonadales bacterium]